MFTGLNAHLGINDLSKSEFIFVHDSRTDGSFLLHHFISTWLKGQKNIVLLGLSQSLGHYASACQKLGVNLQVFKEQGQFIYIDGLNILYNGFKSGASTNPFSPKDMCALLYERLQGLSDNPTLVVIDDLTVFLNIGCSLSDIADTLQFLSALSTQSNCSLLALTHFDEDTDDTELKRVCKNLKHHASLELQVKALATGYSKDLHGELIVTRLNSSQTIPEKKRLHFKVLDKDMKLFAPGTSSAVL